VLRAQEIIDTLPKVFDQLIIQDFISSHSISKSSFDSIGLPARESFLIRGIKDLFKHLPTSQITIGYDYGLVPGYDYNLDFPIGTLISEGNISLPILGFPLQGIYHYTSLKSSFGSNNYFRVSFDYRAYQKKIDEKKSKYIQKLTGQLDSLSSLKQSALQKFYYWQMVEDNLEKTQNKISDAKLENKKDESFIFEKDTIKNILIAKKNKYSTDSISSVADSNKFNLDIGKTDSALNPFAAKEHFDDTISKVKGYQQKFLSLYNRCTEEIQKVQGFLSEINSSERNPQAFLSTLSPLQKAMRYTKKLDIGLCYPSSSMFLVSNVPLRGANFEWNNNDYYLSACAGIVENNLLFNNNPLQNELTHSQNLFNYFDFGNLNQGRKVISAKAGMGKPEDTHLFVGWLSGWGLQSYSGIDSDASITNK
jgi:hypothetical protein